MTKEDHERYWRPVRKRIEELLHGPYDHYFCSCKVLAPNTVAAKLLARYLGLPYPRIAYWEEIELTDEHRCTLAALNNSHIATLLCVLEARINPGRVFKTETVAEQVQHV